MVAISWRLRKGNGRVEHPCYLNGAYRKKVKPTDIFASMGLFVQSMAACGYSAYFGLVTSMLHIGVPLVSYGGGLVGITWIVAGVLVALARDDDEVARGGMMGGLKPAVPIWVAVVRPAAPIWAAVAVVRPSVPILRVNGCGIPPLGSAIMATCA